jgi:uncharacterized protein YecA (UPF0149 family)
VMMPDYGPDAEDGDDSEEPQALLETGPTPVPNPFDAMLREPTTTNVRNMRRVGAATSGPAKPSGDSRRVGRNEQCPCGSGKKYKNCCGR